MNKCMEIHMNEIASQPNPQEDRPLDDLCDCVHPAAVMEARRALGNTPAAEDMATLFSILGDPTRMRVLTALSTGEMCVNDLATAIGINRTTVSHQLRVLRTHRLVRRRRDGKAAYYVLDDDHVKALLAMASDHAAESAAERRMSA
jgi:DNA-binding transcriptional ArsR family regulator